MVKNLFNKLFSKPNILPPNSVVQAFHEKFGGASSVEWNALQNGYEVIFYLDEKEHIARLSNQGEITEFRENMAVQDLPTHLQTIVLQKGEIMNVIAIFRLQELFEYEIITRDKNKDRHLIILCPSGEIRSCRKL